MTQNSEHYRYDYFDFNGDNLTSSPQVLPIVGGQVITGFEMGIGGDFLTELTLAGSLALNQVQFFGSEFHLDINGGVIVDGYVDTISATVIPLPSTLPIFLSAIFSLAIFKRKQRV